MLADGLEALAAKATPKPLHDSGRYFVDGYYCDLTQCDHGDTGEYRNRADGELVALLWNNLPAITAALRAAEPAPEDAGCESDGAVLARMGTDGQKWAQEFIARFGGDEGNMLGWFANAIEAGRTAGIAQGRAEAERQIVAWLEGDADQTEREAARIVANTTGNPRKNAFAYYRGTAIYALACKHNI